MQIDSGWASFPGDLSVNSHLQPQHPSAATLHLAFPSARRLAQQSDAGASLPGFFVRLKDSPLQQPLQQHPLQQPPDERHTPPPLRLSRIIQAKVLLQGTTGKAVIVLQVDRGDGSETIAVVRMG